MTTVLEVSGNVNGIMIKFALSSQTLDRKSTRKIQRAFSEAPIIHFVYGVLAGFAGS